ncbi:hypothetical protein [Xanthomonas prunicola]|uniref:Uncharacterized protein n=1 Tax=Xanthomonas prunicola TaxID=2053930 RepID=A0A9Q9IX93_9XANT|nr:hypothetical protein [Xanthomonas prunicola]UXA48201.1 hypothetical protein M0D44_18170 [Xanthomonas prunicola]UXA56664.1 hypothetical protein M0D47_18125 [Xanthomonas prunicola]UXA62624.1 hypothetical protein M0D48_06535 [Xanthomonas prunicola]UXA64824.1 hypothetical protein M0D43_18200 [Xanthomonas prunicola]
MAPETPTFLVVECTPALAIDVSRFAGVRPLTRSAKRPSASAVRTITMHVRYGLSSRKRSAAVRQTRSELAQGAVKAMRFVRFFSRW